jgi:hypothetical protein
LKQLTINGGRFMKRIRLLAILTLLVVAFALAAVGCQGQQKEEAAAPEEPSSEKAAPTAKAQPQLPPPSRAPIPEPEPEPEAVPEPEPEKIILTVPAGTILDVSFNQDLSSKTNNVGDAFSAQVINDVVLGRDNVIPAGSTVLGTVTQAKALDKKIGGKAELALDFSRIELTSGETVTIRAEFAEAGKSETAKDTATIGGATAGGAILGKILRKDKKNEGKATVIGAVLGAAVGTVIAAKTEGEEVMIPAGTQISLQLTEPAQVSITP